MSLKKCMVNTLMIQMNTMYREKNEKRLSSIIKVLCIIASGSHLKLLSKFTQAIADASGRVKTLAAKYNAELSACKAIATGSVCPTCRRAVTEADVPMVRKAFQESISSIVAEGKEQHAQLEELKAMDAESLATFEKFKEDVTKFQHNVRELTEKRSRLLDNSRVASAQKRAQLEELRGRMQTLTSDLEYGKLNPEEYDRLKACGVEIHQLEAELSALQSAALPDEAEIEARIKAAQEKITDLSAACSFTFPSAWSSHWRS